MNSLRSVSISRRLWLILIVAVVMLLTLGVLMLKQIHDDLYHAKAQKTQHVVQTASGLLTFAFLALIASLALLVVGGLWLKAEARVFSRTWNVLMEAAKAEMVKAQGGRQ